MSEITQIKAAINIGWLSFKHRRLLSYLKQQAWTKINNSAADIWILGQPDAGKSSLLRLLLDEVKPSQRPPITSFRTETGVLLLGESYAKIAKAAPGQRFIFERTKSEFKKSLSTSNPSTIIYVVDFGYNFENSQGNNRSPSPTVNEELKQHKKEKMRTELDHLAYVSKIIKEVPSTLLGIKNFVIVINKIDLLDSCDLQSAKQYYAATGNSEFSRLLQDLDKHINSKEFGFSLLQCCSWPAHQVFNGLEIKSNFDQIQLHSTRNSLIQALDNILK